MKKPLHWKKKEDENRAILSTVCMLKPYQTFRMTELGCSIEDIESAMWGIWEERHKELRPHVYSLLKVSSKLVMMVYKKVRDKHIEKTNVQKNNKRRR